MKILRLLVVSSLASLFVTLVACSSDSSSSGGDACSQAKTVADSCSTKSGDSGTGTTITFDVAQCQNAGDKGQKVAQCIVDNKSNCDCFVKCALSGSCS